MACKVDGSMRCGVRLIRTLPFFQQGLKLGDYLEVFGPSGSALKLN
jgi:hypothetical protein